MGATPGSAKGLFVSLHSEITLCRLLGLYGMLGMKPQSAVSQANWLVLSGPEVLALFCLGAIPGCAQGYSYLCAQSSGQDGG